MAKQLADDDAEVSRLVIASGLLGGRPLAPAGHRARAEVADGCIAELSVYCTGDWDVDRRAEHARAVTLLRP